MRPIARTCADATGETAGVFHRCREVGCGGNSRPLTLSGMSHQSFIRIQSQALDQGGVVTRRQLYRSGWTRWMVEAEVRAGRWHRLGRQSLFVLDAAAFPDPDLARRWWAVLEVGGQAAVDGVTALEHAGLRGFDHPSIQVSVSKSGCYQRLKGVRVYETRRRHPEDLVGSGLPRVRPAVAAVRAALWARTNRQAALVLIMTVQQRIATTTDISAALDSVARHRRRRFLRAVLADIADGVQSMGELDFARLCRSAGLPGPDRQVVRRGPRGRVYLDAYWDEWNVVVEIEGIHHEWESNQVGDTLRQNDLTLTAAAVLRIPVVGLRDQPGPYLDQLCALLRRRGWRP